MRTKTLLTTLATAGLLAGSASAAPVLLGGYDGTNIGTAPIQDPTISATVGFTATGVTNNGGGGLNSALWGTTDLNPDADTSGGKQVVANEDYTIAMTVTNNGTFDLVLDKFHVIARRDNSSSPTFGVVQYTSGDLSDSDGTQVASQTLGSVGTWVGYDFSFASALTDVTLAAGESATFSWIITAANDDGDSGDWLRTDNIAISGEFVPEPSSLALLGLGGLCVLRRRR